MPVATAGAVRVLPFERVREIGYRIILSNSYHLYLRPKIETIAAAGGLHRFIAWRDNILTDSGGFQIFSLSRLMRIGDDALTFRSHIDGSAHSFTPESVVELQLQLGSDIMMPLDHCTAADVGYRQAQIALKRTTSWLERSASYLAQAQQRRAEDAAAGVASAAPGAPAAADVAGAADVVSAPSAAQLFGIVQGNFYPSLRSQSAEQVVSFDLPGYAIGGMSVGEEEGRFLELLAHTAPLLPAEKPRYLMGVGTPEYMLHAIAHGIDMFDCVYPTRAARHGMALTADGQVDMNRGRFRTDQRPLDSNCHCHTCRLYSRAYIHHLNNRKEMMAAMLLSEHNLYFIYELCRQARQAITARRYASFMRDFIDRYRGVAQ